MANLCFIKHKNGHRLGQGNTDRVQKVIENGKRERTKSQGRLERIQNTS